jgi:hypothetical protein
MLVVEVIKLNRILDLYLGISAGKKRKGQDDTTKQGKTHAALATSNGGIGKQKKSTQKPGAISLPRRYVTRENSSGSGSESSRLLPPSKGSRWKASARRLAGGPCSGEQHERGEGDVEARKLVDALRLHEQRGHVGAQLVDEEHVDPDEQNQKTKVHTPPELVCTQYVPL